MKKIKVRIDKKGKTHIEVDGAEGQECETLTNALVRALGTVEDVQRKPEYYVELDEMHTKLYESE